MHLSLTHVDRFSDTKSAILGFCRFPLQMCKRVSELDQEIPESYNADQPVWSKSLLGAHVILFVFGKHWLKQENNAYKADYLFIRYRLYNWYM